MNPLFKQVVPLPTVVVLTLASAGDARGPSRMLAQPQQIRFDGEDLAFAILFAAFCLRAVVGLFLF